MLDSQLKNYLNTLEKNASGSRIKLVFISDDDDEKIFIEHPFLLHTWHTQKRICEHTCMHMNIHSQGGGEGEGNC